MDYIRPQLRTTTRHVAAEAACMAWAAPPGTPSGRQPVPRQPDPVHSAPDAGSIWRCGRPAGEAFFVRRGKGTAAHAPFPAAEAACPTVKKRGDASPFSHTPYRAFIVPAKSPFRKRNAEAACLPLNMIGRDALATAKAVPFQAWRDKPPCAD